MFADVWNVKLPYCHFTFKQQFPQAINSIPHGQAGGAIPDQKIDDFISTQDDEKAFCALLFDICPRSVFIDTSS